MLRFDRVTHLSFIFKIIFSERLSNGHEDQMFYYF